MNLSTATTSSTSTADDEQPPSPTRLYSLPPDIVEAHIFTQLDGKSLASASCSSTTLHHLSSQNHLWSHLCHATWPSTDSPRLRKSISNFPGGGPRAFFSHSFPLPVLDPTSRRSKLPPPPEELISAVDIFYKDELIFSKIQETETVSGWFRCSPFRIDLVEPKDVVLTRIKHPDREDECSAVAGDMTLSWILVDPTSQRSVNLSSHKPISIQRHWLDGDMQVKFSSVLSGAGDKKGHVMCGTVVTCGRSEGGEMQLREVSMEMEDMDEKHLTGKDSLGILHRALEGKKGNAVNKEKVAKRRYEEYVEMKKERKERKVRAEEALDTMCLAVGLCSFVTFWGYLLCKFL